MLLKVMFGPLQVVVLFHIVKRLVMSIDELCQIFHFVFREHMLLYLVHDCCEGLQANPACVLAPFISEEGLNQRARMADEEKGLGGIHLNVLLVLFFTFALRSHLWNSLATRESSVEFGNVCVQRLPCAFDRQTAARIEENLECVRRFRARMMPAP